jgi:hypothetical protein
MVAVEARERGDDKARIVAQRQRFRLADHPAPPTPAVEDRIGEVLEAPRRLAGLPPDR